MRTLPNLISLGTFEYIGCRYIAEGGVVNITRGALIVMKTHRSGTLYILQGSTITSTVAISTSTLCDFDFTICSYDFCDFLSIGTY